MIGIIETDDFRKSLNKLPRDVIRLYEKQKDIFTLNWLDSRLHTKKLIGEDSYSLRITRSYRVIFYFYDDKTVVFVNIGHRKDIYD